jgi:hypothetical protein
MPSGWQIIAFPLILWWQEDFWTLPLYFADLRVGVARGWPPGLPYAFRPLPPELAGPVPDLRHYHPGDLTQQKAYQAYLEAREEVEDILRELKGLPKEEAPGLAPEVQALRLAWQLEQMEADQEAQMTLVDRGHSWLAEILTPEPWEPRPDFGGLPGLKEMADPETAKLRFALWHRELAADLDAPWAPFLLSRTSRAIFWALKGWPGWSQVAKETVTLPGVNSEAGWREVGEPTWKGDFADQLEALLNAADQGAQSLAEQAPAFRQFVQEAIYPAWTGIPALNWELEIWARDPDEGDFGPVLCWGGVNADILPG